MGHYVVTEATVYGRNFALRPQFPPVDYMISLDFGRPCYMHFHINEENIFLKRLQLLNALRYGVHISTTHVLCRHKNIFNLIH